MKDVKDALCGKTFDLDNDGKLDFFEEMMDYDLAEEEWRKSKAYFENKKAQREAEYYADETFGKPCADAPAPKAAKKKEKIRRPKSDDEYVENWKYARSNSRSSLITACIVLFGIIISAPELSKEGGGVVLVGFVALLVYFSYKFIISREEENKKLTELREAYYSRLDEEGKARFDKRMRLEKLKRLRRTVTWLVPVLLLAIWMIAAIYK